MRLTFWIAEFREWMGIGLHVVLSGYAWKHACFGDVVSLHACTRHVNVRLCALESSITLMQTFARANHWGSGNFVVLVSLYFKFLARACDQHVWTTCNN